MTGRKLSKDVYWWAALLCGPLFWAGLWLAGVDIQSPDRFLLYWERFLLVILIYPLLEEIVFRGALQGWLLERGLTAAWGGISTANLLTSLVFTALHFIYHPPFWAAAVFLPSLVFGFFRDRYQRLTSAIALHVFYNAGYALLYMRF